MRYRSHRFGDTPSALVQLRLLQLGVVPFGTTLMSSFTAQYPEYTAPDLAALFEQQGLPFAPITRPQDLFEDPHLRQTGGLADMTLPDGRATRVPLLPLTLDGQRPGVRLQPPAPGQAT